MPPKNDLVSLSQAREQMRASILAYQPSKAVERIEIKIHPVDMMAWLSLQKDAVKIYGANQSDTVSIAGIGQAVSVSGNKTGSLKRVFKKLRSFLTGKYPYLQWYGGFCFDDRHMDGDWKEFGAYRFILPRFELAAQGGKMIFCCNLIGRENIKEILKQLNQMDISRRVLSSRKKTDHLRHVSRRIDNPRQGQWAKNIKDILSDRTVQKVVLARKTILHFTQTPDPWVMLQQLKKVTPNSYHFAFQFGKTTFLGASPERLFRRYQRAVESEALAGTMPKSADPASLQASEKNKREHHLVVEAIEAAFERFCAKFIRAKEPGVLTLANGHHLITGFQGQLKDGVNDEDILKSLHPTPALGGTPRRQAMAAIRKREAFSRGWYGAPVGYVGLDWAEFVVGIRSGLVRGKKLSVYAGAGIIDGSQADDEWNEVENKISNFIKIIQ